MINKTVQSNKATSHSAGKLLTPFSFSMRLICIAALILSLTALVYNQLGEPSLLAISSNTDPLTNKIATHADSPIELLQTKIKTDKQNGDLWFALGHEYMMVNEFDNAALVYHYADKLTNEPDPAIYAAQATARYYINHQQMDGQVKKWIDKTLLLEPSNTSALMLLATDHFLSAQYQLAIDYWQKILDADSPKADRATIIASINQAKGMM